ncbi:UNVERIFIED_CONTAM: hypothetical protein FKN15_061085 [Acipenser sinensis]
MEVLEQILKKVQTHVQCKREAWLYVTLAPIQRLCGGAKQYGTGSKYDGPGVTVSPPPVAIAAR